MHRLPLLALVVILAGCNRTPIGFAPKAAPPKAESPVPAQSEDAAKKVFLDFVRKHVDDPSGLEVVDWGERTKNQRRVRFRCKQIGVTPGGTDQFGNRRTAGIPILLDDCTVIYYHSEDRIREVNPDRCFAVWSARAS